jgi:hypothetical protein
MILHLALGAILIGLLIVLLGTVAMVTLNWRVR